MQNPEFKYFLNGKKLGSKLEYLTSTIYGDFITFFDGETVQSFSNLDFISGEKTKNNRELNDHFKGVLESNTNSTRHKSRNGETHKEIVGDLEGINRPPNKENLAEKNLLPFDTIDLNTITNCKEDKQSVKCNKISCYFCNTELLDFLNKNPKWFPKKVAENIVFNKDSEIHNCNWTKCGEKECNHCYPIKDDVIQNNNRAEKETIEYLQGVKETEGKVDYSEINLGILDLMAQRFSANKYKYPKGNMKKPIDIKSLEWALFRHVKKMVQPLENDYETYEQHLASALCNLSMILDQLKLNKT